MTAKTVTLPEGTIVGTMCMTAKIGDIIQKTGKARKQNVFDLDFGEVAMSGSLYGKLTGESYQVLIVPVAKK